LQESQLISNYSNTQQHIYKEMSPPRDPVLNNWKEEKQAINELLKTVKVFVLTASQSMEFDNIWGILTAEKMANLCT
jgi:hypothetical protein